MIVNIVSIVIVVMIIMICIVIIAILLLSSLLLMSILLRNNFNFHLQSHLPAVKHRSKTWSWWTDCKTTTIVAMQWMQTSSRHAHSYGEARISCPDPCPDQDLDPFPDLDPCPDKGSHDYKLARESYEREECQVFLIYTRAWPYSKFSEFTYCCQLIWPK